jgi:hypothetical protein
MDEFLLNQHLGFASKALGHLQPDSELLYGDPALIHTSLGYVWQVHLPRPVNADVQWLSVGGHGLDWWLLVQFWIGERQGLSCVAGVQILN